MNLTIHLEFKQSQIGTPVRDKEISTLLRRFSFRRLALHRDARSTLRSVEGLRCHPNSAIQKRHSPKPKTENYLQWTVFPGVKPATPTPSGGLLFQKPGATHSAVTNQQTCSHVDEPASLPNFHPLLLHRALRSSARHCCWVACAPSCVCLHPPGRRQPPEPPSVQLS